MMVVHGDRRADSRRGHPRNGGDLLQNGVFHAGDPFGLGIGNLRFGDRDAEGLYLGWIAKAGMHER